MLSRLLSGILRSYYLSFVVPIFQVSLIYACAYRTSQQLFLSIHGESSPIRRRVVSASDVSLVAELACWSGQYGRSALLRREPGKILKRHY
jgi:hypothetical protein